MSHRLREEWAGLALVMTSANAYHLPRALPLISPIPRYVQTEMAALSCRLGISAARPVGSFIAVVPACETGRGDSRSGRWRRSSGSGYPCGSLRVSGRAVYAVIAVICVLSLFGRLPSLSDTLYFYYYGKKARARTRERGQTKIIGEPLQPLQPLLHRPAPLTASLGFLRLSVGWCETMQI